MIGIRKVIFITVIFFSFVQFAVGAIPTFNKLDDWYYPDSEPLERANLQIPDCCLVGSNSAIIVNPQTQEPCELTVGQWLGQWRLVETLPDEPNALAVLERNFNEWGLIVYVGIGDVGVVAEIRKSVGKLNTMSEPNVVYPSGYFTEVISAEADVLGQKVLANNADPSYKSVLPYLPPLRGYSVIGTVEHNSPESYAVMPDGRVGWLWESWGPNAKGKLRAEYFNPSDYLGSITPTVAKRGSLGSGMPVANLGFFNSSSSTGFEEIAFTVCEQVELDGQIRTKSMAYVRLFNYSNQQLRYFRLAPLVLRYHDYLDDPCELGNGKQFYSNLLKVNKSWSDFFGQGMQLNVPDTRVMEVSKGCMAIAIAGCNGVSPRYGMGPYSQDKADGFVPTTVSLCRCLLDWALHEETKERLESFLDKYINDVNGVIMNACPAVSDYGQLLELAALYQRCSKDINWFNDHKADFDKMIDWLLYGYRAGGSATNNYAFEGIYYQNPSVINLIYGPAEPDRWNKANYYFSGDGWVWRGMFELDKIYAHVGSAILNDYREKILTAMADSINYSTSPPFLPHIAWWSSAPFGTMTDSNESSYTNYRHWPEALSAQCLGEPNEQMMIDYRGQHGGEMLGMTRFHLYTKTAISIELDDWPLFNYAYSLLAHDEVRHFLLAYYGHMAHHQTRGTFTGYEQVYVDVNNNGPVPCRNWVAFNCVPSTLAVPIMTKWMLVFEERDEDILWLCKAVPQRWYRSEFSVTNASTRWGLVSFDVTSDNCRCEFTFDVDFTEDVNLPSKLRIRVRHPEEKTLVGCGVLEGSYTSAVCIGDYVEIDNPCQHLKVKMIFNPKTAGCVIIDDMESYNSAIHIYDTWQDGRYNDSGAEVTIETQNLYHGDQTMRYDYDNTSTGSDPCYSEIEWTYSTSQDWAGSGYRGLELWFYGNSGNSAEQMYLALEDANGNSATVFYEDANDLKKQQWQPWRINLQDFNQAGVKLTCIEKIYIGFGNRDNPAPGGSGTIYFDDIIIFHGKCCPEYGPSADFTDDCMVDFEDLGLFSFNWLGVDICDVNDMVSHWKFDEGTGTTAYDSQGGNDGTIYSSPPWVAGKVGDYALDFDGSADYIQVSGVSGFEGIDDVGSNVTITAWIYKTAQDSLWDTIMATDAFRLQIVTDRNIHWAWTDGVTSDGSRTYSSGKVTLNKWNHIAVTKQGNNIVFYIDSNQVGSATINGRTRTINTLRIGRDGLTGIGENGYFDGIIDDVRVYDSALAPEDIELIYLNGMGVFLADPEFDLYRDGIIDFKDYAFFAQMWLKEQLWP